MKTTYKALALGIVATTMWSCADDLNTEFLGGYVTTEQKEEVLGKDPEMAMAAVTGAFANFNLYNAIYDEHFDFGFPTTMIGLDLQTEDYLCKSSGYNWFSFWEGFTGPTIDGCPTNEMWFTVYKQIFTANALISTIPLDTESDELKFYLANGLALRAFDYFTLIQLYQYNYVGHESAPGVPIITEENSEDAAANGAPRASVQEVYDQILSDLDNAVRLFSESPVEPAQVIDSKPMRLLSLASAYGLRARVKLVMHDYAGAAQDARAAIQNFKGRPYSMAEISVPAFTSLDEPSWMWGIAIATTDDVVLTGIVNFPSHQNTFTDGYTSVGAWKYCGYKLYQKISATDVRKGWFLDDNYQSDHLNAIQQAYVNQFIGNPYYDGQDNESCLYPQTNVKFNSYDGTVPCTEPASDIPLMRVEEMYLTEAEAIGMSGNLASGKQLLEQFVQTYRDPSYKSYASTPEAFQEECWIQRRIELWGEGQAYYDVMRLNKGIDRTADRCPTDFRYVIEPYDPVLIYCIPRNEVNANAQISEDECNESSTRPKPVSE